MSKTNKHSDSFTIVFDGQINQVDVNTLISSLTHTAAVLQEINKIIDPSHKMNVKIKALEKGSFIIDFEVVYSLLEKAIDLFANEKSANILQNLGGVYALYRILKGGLAYAKKRLSNGNLVVYNEEDESLEIDPDIYNIYAESTVIRAAISKNFEAIQNDTPIESFEIRTRDKTPIFQVKKDEFYRMTSYQSTSKNDNFITLDTATLTIVKVNFEQNQKWDFYFNGNKISASIKDEQFYETIDRGEAFAKGDRLKVSLEVVQSLDSDTDTYINKSYKILKVHEHIARKEQKKLF